MIKTAFSTLGCPDWNWDELLHQTAEFGFDGIELRQLRGVTDLLTLPEFRKDRLATRRRELEHSGLRICGLGSSVRFDDPDSRHREEQVEIGRAYLELARELGADFVRVFGDTLPEGGDAAQRDAVVAQVRDGLQRLGEFGETVGVDVLIETHGDFSDSHLMRDTLEGVASPAVGLLWDTHHPWRFFNEPLPETLERLRPWIRHTHWKDSVKERRRSEAGTSDEQVREAAQQAHQLMSGHRHADYVLFGGGEFPALECLRLLRSIGYEGWYSLEWEKMWHPEIEAAEVAFPLFSRKIRQLWELSERLA